MFECVYNKHRGEFTATVTYNSNFNKMNNVVNSVIELYEKMQQNNLTEDLG